MFELMCIFNLFKLTYKSQLCTLDNSLSLKFCCIEFSLQASATFVPAFEHSCCSRFIVNTVGLVLEQNVT